ncbi:hypothetical protein AB0F16_40900, partial [Streptomyces tanashiensis]
MAAAAPLTVLAGVAPFAIGIGGPGAPLASYFRRDRMGLSAARVVWAPLISCAGLALLTVPAVVHFDLLTGRTGAVNTALLVPLPVVLAAGLLVARRIRRTDPERYASLTTVDVETPPGRGAAPAPRPAHQAAGPRHPQDGRA